MRFIGKAAIVMAIVGMTNVLAPVSAQAEDAGHKIAVVDVAKIFKDHPGIVAQVQQVENDLKSYDGELQGKREELKNAAEQLKSFKVGSAEYTRQEELVASLESKLRLDMARKRKELADAEARIYFDNYQRISEGVKVIAQYNKINIVLRYNSEEMDLEKGDSVIRGVMKSIVYHDASLDMTPAVMGYLDRELQVAGNASAASTTGTQRQ